VATGEVRQKPIELILARNFLASLSTPSFLVDHHGQLVYFNDAAGALLGKRFEETGAMSAREWGARWGPFGEDGAPLPYEELPLTTALKQGHPAAGRFTVRDSSGRQHQILSSALPVVGADAFRGAIVFFWPLDSSRDLIGASP